MSDLVGARHTPTGRLRIEAINNEIFFVKLDQFENAFSPSTRYEDFAVSPGRFHWQSQSATGEDSPTGRRYVFQNQNGARFLLFVRPKRGDPFFFLGLAQTLQRPLEDELRRDRSGSRIAGEDQVRTIETGVRGVQEVANLYPRIPFAQHVAQAIADILRHDSGHSRTGRPVPA